MTLLLILLCAGKWAALIPMATLGGILLVVAYNMSEWRVFARLLRGSKSDVVVLVTTFALTVVVDLVYAIQAGIALAALLFMRRMAEVTQIRSVTGTLMNEEEDDPDLPDVAPVAGVDAFAIQGSLCFGAAQRFSEMIGQSTARKHAVVIDMRRVLAMDATGLQVLEEVAGRFKRDGTRFLLSGVHAQPLFLLQKCGLYARIGEENLFPDFTAAVVKANELARDAQAGAPTKMGA